MTTRVQTSSLSRECRQRGRSRYQLASRCCSSRWGCCRQRGRGLSLVVPGDRLRAARVERVAAHRCQQPRPGADGRRRPPQPALSAGLRAAVHIRVLGQPDSAEAHSNLAFAFVQTGRLQEAVAPLQRALELQPDYSEAHLGLAHAFSAVGQPHAAVEQFREALRLQSAAEPLSRRPATILSWGGEERRRIGGPIDGPPTGGYSLERELRAEFDDPSVQERDRPQIG